MRGRRSDRIDGGRPPRADVRWAFTGILLGMLVAILSTSIINTSLPTMVSDLRGSQATLTWVVTGPLLAVTVTTPIWGRLSDLVGRKPLLLLSLLVFIIASLGAGLASTPGVEVAARTMQGVATGGLLSLSQVTLADLISPRERGRYMGLFGAVVTAGTAGGPLLGGFVTDTFGWRWNFFALVPFAVAALLVVELRLTLPAMGTRGRIDVVGSALLAVSISTLLVWLSLAGELFAWSSALSWALGIVSAVLLATTVLVELRIADPVLPLRMFRQRTYALAVSASFCVGIVIYAVSVYLSQYMQLSRGATPAQAGLVTLPQVAANLIGSTVAGTLISRFGAWKPWLVSGAVLMMLGTFLFATLRVDTPFAIVFVATPLAGLGLGMTLQNLILAVQNAADPREIGAASSGVAFFRSLGGAAGVTVLGAILSAHIDAATARSPGSNGTSLAQPLALPPALRAVVEQAYGEGAGLVFLCLVPIAATALICIILIPNAALGTRTGVEQRAAMDAAEAAGSEGAVLLNMPPDALR